MIEKKLVRHAPLVLSMVFGLLSTALPTLSMAQGAITFKNICSMVGPNAPEVLGDRDGHTFRVSLATCRVEGGPLAGGVMDTSVLWESDKEGTTALSGDGVIRKSGATTAYRLLDGKQTLVMKDGKVVGWTSPGKGVYTMATGSVAALSGKTFSWNAHPTAAREYVIDVTMD